MQIIATLSEVPCIAVRVTLRTGATASSALVTMRTSDADQLPAGPLALYLSDGATNETIKSFAVVGVSRQPGGIALVRLADRRGNWGARVTATLSGVSLAAAVARLLGLLGESTSLPGLVGGSRVIGTMRLVDQPVATALEALLARYGQGYWIGPDGKLEAISVEPLELQHPLLISHSPSSAPRPSWIRVVAPARTEAITVGGPATPVCRDLDGNWRSLSELASEWGINQSELRRAVLVPGGVRKLAGDSPHAALLEQHAWRSYALHESARSHLPFLATGPSGESPKLMHTGFRPRYDADLATDDPFDTSTDLRPESAPFELDGVAGVVTFSQVTAELEAGDSPALESRMVLGPPSVQISAMRRTAASAVLFTVSTGPGGDGSTVTISRGDLVGDTSDPVSNARLRRLASDAAAAARKAIPERTLRAVLAGAHLPQPAVGATIRMRADADHGLTTRITAPQAPTTRVLRAFAEPEVAPIHVASIPGSDSPPPPAPVTALRTGPVILRGPDGSAFAFAECTDIDAATGGMEVTKPAPMAGPFYLTSSGATAGHWAVAVPVRVIASGGSVRLLSDHATTDTDHQAVAAEAVGGTSPLPIGTDGLLVQGMDGQTMLLLPDRPLIAQNRGNEGYSTEVREIDGDQLDADRRGPLQFPIVLALSSEHAAAGVGGTDSQRGWVPMLNLKDFTTATPEDWARAGRGLFADESGYSIGKLANRPLNGGPILTDADNCTKHRYGQVTVGTETFTECAGHLSTEAFFKLTGSDEFDGPIDFIPEKTTVEIGSGEEYQAEIKFKDELLHSWNGEIREGKWVVTYRIPIMSSPPGEEWPPDDDPRMTAPRGLTAPGHHWAPPAGDPSSPPPEEEPEGPVMVPWRGETISSVGYAPLDGEGYPDPALGGGVYFMPAGMRLSDGAPWDYAGQQYWITLHPGVGLALGKPNYSDDATTPSGGFRLQLDSAQDLIVSAVADDGTGAPERSLVLDAGLDTRQNAIVAGEDKALAFFGGEPVSKPTVSGGTDGNEALISLIEALSSLGLISNETT